MGFSFTPVCFVMALWYSCERVHYAVCLVIGYRTLMEDIHLPRFEPIRPPDLGKAGYALKTVWPGQGFLGSAVRRVKVKIVVSQRSPS